MLPSSRKISHKILADLTFLSGVFCAIIFLVQTLVPDIFSLEKIFYISLTSFFVLFVIFVGWDKGESSTTKSSSRNSYAMTIVICALFLAPLFLATRNFPLVLQAVLILLAVAVLGVVFGRR